MSDTDKSTVEMIRQMRQKAHDEKAAKDAAQERDSQRKADELQESQADVQSAAKSLFEAASTDQLLFTLMEQTYQSNPHRQLHNAGREQAVDFDLYLEQDRKLDQYLAMNHLNGHSRHFRGAVLREVMVMWEAAG